MYNILSISSRGHVRKRFFLHFVTALSYPPTDLLHPSFTFLALSVRFLCVQWSLTRATLQKSDQCPDQVESPLLKQGKFVSRGRKRILSQNKRWRANPFPCAVKQSLHSVLSKWHLIWFCCWSLRYPECFQDMYSGWRATLDGYEGEEIWWAVTRHHAQERDCARSNTQTQGSQTVENILKSNHR